MTFGDTARQAGANLLRRKGRTALTVIGVTIGVAALVLLVSLGIGVERGIIGLFETDDATSIVIVSRAKPEKNKKRGMIPGLNFGNLMPLTNEDVDVLKKIPGALVVYPDLLLLLEAECAEAPDTDSSVRILALPPEEVDRLRPYLLAGDFWKTDGETSIVIPTDWIDKPPEGGWPALVGKTMKFTSRRPEVEPIEWTIAGVVDSRKMGLRGEATLAPIGAARDLRHHMKGGVFRSLYDEKEDRFYTCFVRVEHPGRLTEVRNRIKNSGYEALTALDIIESIGTVFKVIQAFLAAVGGIGLVVSLFGIANTMAMSVLERTREIGIMKALGATRRDILRLFLMEAASIGLVGGSIGLLLGWVGGLLLNGLSHVAFEVPDDMTIFHVSIWLVALSIAFSVLVAMIAGFLPARRAARLDPVQALRYE